MFFHAREFRKMYYQSSPILHKLGRSIIELLYTTHLIQYCIIVFLYTEYVLNFGCQYFIAIQKCISNQLINQLISQSVYSDFKHRNIIHLQLF